MAVVCQLYSHNQTTKPLDRLEAWYGLRCVRFTRLTQTWIGQIACTLQARRQSPRRFEFHQTFRPVWSDLLISLSSVLVSYDRMCTLVTIQWRAASILLLLSSLTHISEFVFEFVSSARLLTNKFPNILVQHF